MFCDDLEGWDRLGGGRDVQEGGSMCILMTDLPLICVQLLWAKAFYLFSLTNIIDNLGNWNCIFVEVQFYEF